MTASAEGVGAWYRRGRLVPDPRRFYDGGNLDDGDAHEGPDPTKPMRVCLERHLEQREGRVTSPEKEVFALERRIAYHHRDHAEPFVVPARKEFRTDLASVPSIFTWLVPRSGVHLPAALVHDALVDAVPPEVPGAAGKQPYLGPYVARYEADRVFRDAMADCGTGTVRRWLTWTGVTLRTLLLGKGSRSRGAGIYYACVMVVTMLGIAALGLAATLDLLDLSLFGHVVRVPWMGGPWGESMGGWLAGQGFWAELGRGVLAAALIPAVTSAFWWTFWRAGLIAGIALALLLHVTIVVGLLTLLLVGLEWLTVGRRAKALGAARVTG